MAAQFCVLTMGLLLTADPVPPDKDELKRLEGTWQVKGFQVGIDGKWFKPPVQPPARNETWTFKDGKFTVKSDVFKDATVVTFGVDPSKQPTIDYVGPPPATPCMGIYELTGDSLRICVVKAGERPKDFAPKDGHYLNTLKRKKN